jgi:ABC-type uncharacterized transport system substrate-binding protein
MFRPNICIYIFLCLFFANVCLAEKSPPKRVFFLDSYHKGYEWSDCLKKGFMKIMESHPDVIVKFHWMDAKRNSSEEACKIAALEAKKIIEEFKPDVLIAADDSASKYVVLPYFSKSLPVVFLGINANISDYGYPNENSTGISEPLLGGKIRDYLSKYAKGKRIGFLGGDTLTSRTMTRRYNKELFNEQMKSYHAKTFEDYKRFFLKAQDEVDMLIVYNNAGVSDWDEKDACAFFLKNTNIPTGASLPWMAKYALVSVLKDPEGIGIKAARMTLDILRGTPPSQMPYVSNDKIILTVNLKIAEKMGIVFPLSILKTAKIIR